MIDPYAVLGVASTATPAEITHAYRRHLRDHHPDTRAPQPDSPADEQLRQILAAYFVLRDPTRRAAYDRARSNHHDSGPTQIKVTHTDASDDQLPLWAGPVHWHH